MLKHIFADTENLMNHKNHDHGDNEEEMEVDRAKGIHKIY